MNKDANDDEAVTGSSFQKVVLDLLDRDISAPPSDCNPSLPNWHDALSR